MFALFLFTDTALASLYLGLEQTAYFLFLNRLQRLKVEEARFHFISGKTCLCMGHMCSSLLRTGLPGRPFGNFWRISCSVVELFRVFFLGMNKNLAARSGYLLCVFFVMRKAERKQMFGDESKKKFCPIQQSHSAGKLCFSIHSTRRRVHAATNMKLIFVQNRSRLLFTRTIDYCDS